MTKLEALFEKVYADGIVCKSCPYNTVTSQNREPGYMPEILRECTIANIENCPGVIEAGGEDDG